MKRIVVRFKKTFCVQGRLYEEGFSIDALRLPKKTKDELSCYLGLNLAGIFLVTADDVEELVEPEL